MVSLVLLAVPSTTHAQRVIRGPGTKVGAGCTGISFGALIAGPEVLSYPYVTRINPGSPAERAGLQAGDTIFAVNGRDTFRPDGHFRYEAFKPYIFRIKRGETLHDITVVAGKVVVDSTQTPPKKRCQLPPS